MEQQYCEITPIRTLLARAGIADLQRPCGGRRRRASAQAHRWQASAHQVALRLVSTDTGGAVFSGGSRWASNLGATGGLAVVRWALGNGETAGRNMTNCLLNGSHLTSNLMARHHNQDFLLLEFLCRSTLFNYAFFLNLIAGTPNSSRWPLAVVPGFLPERSQFLAPISSQLDRLLHLLRMGA